MPRYWNKGFAGGSGRSWLFALVAATILSFAAKVIIARNTYGSLDALLWETNLQELRHDGLSTLYKNGTVVRIAGQPDHHEIFNHPPFMIRLLAGWGWLSDVTGQPLRFWLRATCAVADLASVALLVAIMLRTQAVFQPATLLLVAASPVSLMISGFHGNVDPIMIALVLLSVYLLETGSAGLAGMALGMAMNFKIVPLIFLPAMLLYLSGKKRIELLLGMVGVFVIGSMPILAQDPALVWNRVFGYSPQLVSGRWGISRFVYILASQPSFDLYARTAKIPLLCLLALAAIWFNAREHKPPLALQCGFAAFLFLALTPGFGVQYLAWAVPWACFVTFRQALAFHATSGLLIFSCYNRGADGLPWYFAYNGTSEWYGSVVFIGLLCWLTICGLMVHSARSMGIVTTFFVNRGRIFTTLHKEVY